MCYNIIIVMQKDTLKYILPLSFSLIIGLSTATHLQAQTLESSSFIIDNDTLGSAAGSGNSSSFGEQGYLGGIAVGSANSASFNGEFGFYFGDQLVNIALGCDPSHTISQIIGYGSAKLDPNNSLKCTTITDNLGGYQLTFKVADTQINDKLALAADSNVGLDSLPSNSWAGQPTDAFWAINANPSATYGDNTWTGLTHQNKTLTTTNTATPITGEIQEFIFGAWIGSASSLTAGDYSTQLVVTATAI